MRLRHLEPDIGELYRRHACEVELDSTSQSYPGVKAGMSNVAGHFCSHIGTVSQAVPAAMSQVHRGGMLEPGFLWCRFTDRLANTAAAYRENVLIACRQALETIDKAKRAYS